MHEMPVTQAMLNMALQHADGQRITDIYLRVGMMSSIVPESVEVFFDYLSQDTLAEGATLHFERVPIEMTCLDCGRRADLSQWADQRPQAIMMEALHRGCKCGSKRLRVTAGVGFEMVSLNVEPASRKHPHPNPLPGRERGLAPSPQGGEGRGVGEFLNKVAKVNE